MYRRIDNYNCYDKETNFLLELDEFKPIPTIKKAYVGRFPEEKD